MKKKKDIAGQRTNICQGFFHTLQRHAGFDNSKQEIYYYYHLVRFFRQENMELRGRRQLGTLKSP